MKQMKNYWKNYSWIITECGPITIVLCLIVIAPLVLVNKFSELPSSSLAVGTIITIMLGFVATIRQISDQQKKLEEKSKQACKLTYLATTFVLERLDNAQSPPCKRKKDLQEYKTGQAIRDIQKIPYIDLFHTLDNRKVVWECLYEIRIRLVAINKILDEFWKNENQPNRKDNVCVNKFFKSSKENIKETKEKCQILKDALQESGIEIGYFPKFPNEFEMEAIYLAMHQSQALSRSP